MRALLAFVCCVAAALGVAHAAPRIVAAPVTLGVSGVPEVGKTLVPIAAPLSGTCQWTRDGSAIAGATSCASYSIVTADGGHFIGLQVTTAGKSAYTAITMSGSPSTAAQTGVAYSFTPTISGGSGSNTCFTLALPSWLTQNGSTCGISGTPSTGGTYPAVSLGVKDSVGGQAIIGPFSLTVLNTCPQGVGDTNDGCSGALSNASVLLANFFTSYANQSGQTYLARPTWNVACVDYACGPYTSQAAAGDPITAGNHPSQCTTTQTGTPPNDYYTIDCSSAATSAWTWQHLDFGPKNGHGPTFVVFHPSVSTQQTFDDFWFSNPNCVGPNNWLSVQNIATLNFTAQNFDYDGGASCRTSLWQNGFSIFTTGTVVLQRGRMANVQGRPAMFLGQETTSVTMQYLLVDGYDFNPTQGHGEIETITPATGHAFGAFTAKYMTSLLGSNTSANGTTQWYVSSGGTTTISNVVIDHTTIVSNTIGGAGVVRGSATAHMDDGSGGTCTADPCILTIDSLASGVNIAAGSNISVGSGGSVLSAIVMENVSGSGVGSKWIVYCTQPPGSYCTGTRGPGGLNATPITNFASQAATITNGVASYGCLEVGHNVITNLTITNNRCDSTGGTFGRWSAVSGTCTNPATFTGNIDLVSGANDNTWALNVAGC